MTPLARISAAIEKLERLKADSTPGPWSVDTAEHVLRSHHRGEELKRFTVAAVDPVAPFEGNGDGGVASVADADLIVTLHRTIPALLTILKPALAEIQSQGDAFSIESCDEPSAMQDALDLADAILGGES